MLAVCRIVLVTLSVFALGALTQPRSQAADAGWVQRGGKAKYSVEEGAVVGTTVSNTENSFLCTARDYADFVLELDFKVHPKLNSGVQIRSLRVPGSPEMSGYQVDYGKGWYGKLYDESRRNKVVGEAKDMAAATAALKEGEMDAASLAAALGLSEKTGRYVLTQLAARGKVNLVGRNKD